jgi:hypothetical protein
MAERNGSAISPTARLWDKQIKDKTLADEAEIRRTAELERLTAEQAADDAGDKDQVIDWRDAITTPVLNPNAF